MSTTSLLNTLLADDSIKSLLQKSDELYWETPLAEIETFNEQEQRVVCRVSFLLTNYVLTAHEDGSEFADAAYKLLKNFPISTESGEAAFDEIIGFDLQDKQLLYYFYLASLALKLDKVISARIVLNSYTAQQRKEGDWSKRVLSSIFRSLLFLIRKANGFSDIKKAAAEIEELRREQKEFEDKYISEKPLHLQAGLAMELVALYHISKALTDTADYLTDGYKPNQRKIDVVVRQHVEIALSLIKGDSRLKDFIGIIRADLQMLIQNSIWTHTSFHDKVKKLCKYKANVGILELLPSQQRALNDNMLSVAANATILQMPTSAGKTLMAEFNILVTKSLRSDARIVYVVPSRALMNQVFFDLKGDFEELDLKVERTSAAVEVDPAEDEFLTSDNIDVMVTTPEKLDLLIRRRHPSVEDVSLFIIDEAHTIENGIRGARLELLMTMLKRERPEAKYMLLSPFLPGNGEAMKEWLGGGNVIHIDWKPSEKIVFGLDLTSKKIKYDILATPFAPQLSRDLHFETENTSGIKGTSKQDILNFATEAFVQDGRTQLILCKGKPTANETALKIAEWHPNTSGNIPEEVRLVVKYMNEEIGCQTHYTELLEKGITVHHAGLSDESKILIEHLIRQGYIRYVCATTTIAEGVNFPVSSVYFDTYQRGSNNRLSSNDFWNIAGRAGRTMVDDFGKIILPFNSETNIAHAKELISKSAEELVSVLARLFTEREQVKQIIENDQNFIYTLNQNYGDSFGPLFQYFVHLLNVADNEYVADIEDLFKDSLAYSLMDREEDRRAFIELCKLIYLSIQAKYEDKSGALKFADKTGFSVPSVLRIMNEKANNAQIADLDSWQPENMFDRRNHENLTEKIKVIAALKETELGTISDKAQFNPALVAKMLIGWVKGDKLHNISTIHPYYANQPDITKQVSDFIRYMNDMRFKASWGLSALEGIVRGNHDEMKDSYIPSFVYYGVDEKRALALRMLGIPRSLSKSLSVIIPEDMSKCSFGTLRKKILELRPQDWNEFKPYNSSLSGEEWQRIARLLMK